MGFQLPFPQLGARRIPEPSHSKTPAFFGMTNRQGPPPQQKLEMTIFFCILSTPRLKEVQGFGPP